MVKGIDPKPEAFLAARPVLIWTIGPPNPSRFGAALAKGQGLDPPNLGAALAKGQANPSGFGVAPKWTRIGRPNPSRFPTGQGWDPPTLHDLAPQPFTIWSGHPNGQGCTPQTLDDLERLPIGQGFAPPPPANPSRFGAALAKDKDWTPQPFTIWSGSQTDEDGPPLQPFTIWSGSQMDKDWTPPQPFTIWRVFLSRKLTADFLLPNSVYTMCHLH